MRGKIRRKKNIRELEDIWFNADARTYFPRKLKFNSITPSFHSIDGLRSILHKHLNVRNFEELNIPLYIHCLKYKEKEDVFFNKGNLIDPILASCSIIPLFPAYEINNVKYVDGYTNKHSAIKKTISLGCDQVILVDSIPYNIKFKLKNLRTFNPLKYLNMIFNNKSMENEVIEVGKKVITINPIENFNIGRKDFRHTSEFINMGEIQAEEALKDFY